VKNGAASAIGLLIAAAVLYLARDVLIPFALAILLAFLLAPAARRLERWKLGRVLSTVIVVAFGFSLIGTVGYVAGTQAVSLAAKLPEYRKNVTAKIRDLKKPGEGKIAQAQKALKDLEKQADPTPQAPLQVTQTPESPYAQLIEFVTPFAKPVGTALAVIVFTILMLLHRESMREKLIGLIGPRRINVTTQALDEASYRVSRYLLMQLVVNACFGIPFGIALYFIGIPNAALWGLLATLLRFIPYAGVWIAVSMPLALAFAISDGWSQVAWVAGVFLTLELVLINIVEPLVYGRSAGLSPIAIILAALFWTLLWGPVGLLLATPLTVCVAVMGRYMPELGYLNVILGVEPALTPPARFYQRLLAKDEDEAEDLAEDFANEKGLLALYDEMVIPALALAEQDRHAHTLEEERERFIFDTIRELVEYLEDRSKPKDELESRPKNVVHRPAPPVCIVGVRDEADHVAALVLARMLEAPEFNPQVISHPLLAADTLDELERKASKVVCLSAVPPHAAAHAGHLCKRLKDRFPDLKVVVALWMSESSDKLEARLRDAGVDQVVTRLPEAIAALRELQQMKSEQLKSGTDHVYVDRDRPARRGKAGEPRRS
jgi:predicted PurR-regulated permease PerM